MPHLLILSVLECRQQLRSGLIWLILGVGFLYANPFFNSSPSLWEALYTAVGHYSMSVLSLIFGLWAIVSAMRERRQRVSVLVESTRVPSHTLFIGQWLGLAFTTFMLLIVLHILVSLVFIDKGASISVIAVLKSITVICLPWALSMVTLGFVLGSFMPIFISVPAVGAVWYATAIASLFGKLERWISGPWATLVDPTTAIAASASVAFGFLPLERLVVNRLFYLAVTLLLLGIGALFYKRSRENRLSVGALGIIVVGLITASFVSMVAFSQFPVTTEQAFQGIEDHYEQLLGLARADQAEVARYEISVGISPGQTEMTVDAVLYIRNNGEQPLDSFVFTLYEKFRVEKITNKEKDLEWGLGPSGHYLVELTDPLLPNEQTSFAISYGGEVYEWHLPQFSNRPELFAFLRPAGFILPSSISWYPILGVRPAESESPPSSYGEKLFSVDINGHKKPIAINLPQAGLASWEGYASDLFLASANWHDIKNGRIHLWYTPEQVENAQLLVDKLDYMYELCKTYLGETGFETILVITVPQNLHRSMRMEVDGRQVGVVFVTDTRLSSEAKGSNLKSFNVNYHQQELLLEVLSLWLDLGSVTNLDFADNTKTWGIAGYMWSLFREQYPGLPGTVEQEREFRQLRYSGNRFEPSSYAPGLTLQRFSKDEEHLWLELDGLRQQGGIDAVKSRLQELLSEIQ